MTNISEAIPQSRSDTHSGGGILRESSLMSRKSSTSQMHDGIDQTLTYLNLHRVKSVSHNNSQKNSRDFSDCNPVNSTKTALVVPTKQHVRILKPATPYKKMKSKRMVVEGMSPESLSPHERRSERVVTSPEETFFHREHIMGIQTEGDELYRRSKTSDFTALSAHTSPKMKKVLKKMSAEESEETELTLENVSEGVCYKPGGVGVVNRQSSTSDSIDKLKKEMETRRLHQLERQRFLELEQDVEILSDSEEEKVTTMGSVRGDSNVDSKIQPYRRHSDQQTLVNQLYAAQSKNKDERGATMMSTSDTQGHGFDLDELPRQESAKKSRRNKRRPIRSSVVSQDGIIDAELITPNTMCCRSSPGYSNCVIM
eukprot:CAMPEP_0114975820 /NCGR_PEP_ID=MMETSP0216-20121206/2319_1 /TAXON_ID=223996 /ORGANISM="Protocruzia adherens, Strain Boccale" /LENGTH=369 /DNA_ID=CAMNT_0002336659 /DNA_START=143 /DNA_END=1252 /DNA_ORIENTATION=-